MDMDNDSTPFAVAVAALGGVLPTSRLLGISQRSIQRFLSGQMEPNAGVLADTADALRRHARACTSLAMTLEGLDD